ncbi:MATH domain and coiled-coil domain-containing protein-like [Heracleum sosnowskyi]|uniref:MATH domain and coiled-coil domain-containing protein-like n=1 Tax=Heracleum sosnowskyi TaxID=360622 RepID=A0AAD8J6H6_9APIA|nr:MATH domain and coiled-coil domain-containing protein-like [Heracleum sosnowskyi]
MDEDENSCVPASLVRRTYRDIAPAEFTLKIEDFPLLLREMNTVMDNYHSGCFKAGGYRWRLSLYPFGNNKTRRDTNYMSIYLELAEEINSPVDVIIKFFVYDHIRERYLMVEDANKQVKRFNKARSAHGISEFILVASFFDASNGYLLDEMSCVFGVELFFTKNRMSKTVVTLSNDVNIPDDKEFFTWKLEKFSKRHNKVYYSHPFVAGERKWKLIIYPRWEKKWLALGLVLDGTNISNSSSRGGFLNFRGLNRNGDHKLYAKYTLVVKDQLNLQDIAKEGSDYFSEVTPCRVRRNFMELSKLHDQSKGFLGNDVLMVQVRVNAIFYEHDWHEA